MKTKLLNHTLAILFVLLLQATNSQTISVDSTFTTDGEIFPFDTTQAIYGLSIESGSVSLFSDTSLVRVILIDTMYNEYMVYEAYPLIVSDTFFDVSNVCDETCYLNGIYPYSLEIQLTGAEVYLDGIDTNRTYNENADSLQLQHKKSLEWNKVTSINNHLQDEHLWGADTTTTGMLSYMDKKEEYGYKYNILGFDYYSDGIYSVFPDECYKKDTTGFISYFSWENRHNSNDPNSEYYGGSHGWMTPLKKQKDLCKNTCWIFSVIGGLEACINLFFNKTTATNYIDIDAILSEQHVLSCNEYNNNCAIGNPSHVHYFIRDFGIEDLGCVPNQQNGNTSVILCDQLDTCSTPDYKISSNGIRPVSPGWSNYKVALINYGPGSIGRYNSATGYPHYMTLMGFRVIQEGDTITRGRVLEPIVVDTANRWRNSTSFQFKDSGGNSKFYWEVMHEPPGYPRISDFQQFTGLEQMDEAEIELERMCIDIDKDGYFNWGIMDKPGVCPNCPDSIDSDDSNPRLGPYDSNYHSIPVAPQVLVYRKNLLSDDEIINRNDIHVSSPALNDSIMEFYIENNGDAQFNLTPYMTITFTGQYANEFSSVVPDTNIIRMNGEKWDFQIIYHDAPEPAIAKVQINNSEDDIEKFVFYLAIGDCNMSANNEYISTDTTWNNMDIKVGNVIILDSSTLTITDTVLFNEPSSIIIRQGSRLVLDGGILTKMCDSLWQGVDIIGHDTISQAWDQYHGTLQIDNGGTIEYANIGAETICLDSRDETGGIIKADQGVFHNNIIDVQMLPFTNTHPLTYVEWDNLSGFTDCEFTTDSNLYKLNLAPDNHIRLLDTKGIYLTNCYFTNENINVNDPTELGIGIFSNDSKYYVCASCYEYDQQQDSCVTWNVSKFAGLEYGIYAINGRSNLAPAINRCKFEDNYTGVYLSETPQASVTQCDFNLRKTNLDDSDNEIYCGIYINSGCDGFQVEENYFYNSDSDPSSGSDSTIGIVVNNSGAMSNEVYNNYFEDLDFGVSAQGANKGESTGLQIKCNDFDSCEYNIVVVPDSCVGIYYYQGSDTALATGSANNLFSYMGSIEYVDLNDINNMGEFVTYYYPPNYGTYRVKPIYIDTLKVGAIASSYPNPWDDEIGCPSNLASSDTSIQEIRSLSVLYENKADSINAQLQELEDGGNTEELNTDIQTSWPEDAYDVYSELINNSPYLSDSVMVSAVKKEDVLSGTMVTDVLSANPQAAKRDTVMDAIYKRNNPLNNDQLNQVNQGLSQIGLKEKLEAELGFYITKKAYYNSSLLRIFRKDTSLTSINDSIISVYKRINNVDAKYQLAIEYLWLRDTSNAMNILDSIPFKFTLNNNQIAQHTDYEDYFNWIIEIIADGRDVFSADSTGIEGLYDIYNNASGKPKCLIRNLLIQIDALTYYEPYYFPTFYKSSKIEYPDNRQSNENKYLFIYPNPSNSYYYVECKLDREFYKSLVTISDINGRLIDEILMDCQSFRTIIDARNYKPGLYVGRLYSEGNIIESAKFIIIH